jgi:hypothetical protein
VSLAKRRPSRLDRAVTEATLAGSVVAGRYEVEALLGKGGMGEVYRARDRERDVHVALKVVLPGELGPRLIPRIMREARLAARFHHPNVVPVLDHGRWGEARDRVYLTMELIDGVTLGELARTPMKPGPACAIATQLLSALAHVHARGVLHRDIKPENVLVARESDGALSARLADFGIAAAMEGDAQPDLTRLTHDGTVLGTPRYMAPEQIEGRARLGPPADLYAVGLILYELVSGQVPFDGPVRRVLFEKLSKDAPPPPIALPDGLCDVVLRLIARAPQARFPLAADALAALSPFVERAQMDEAAWRALKGERPTASVSTGSATLAATLAEQAARAEGICGRHAERAALEALAQRAESGEGIVCVVTGEAGVGKSALLESVAVELNEAGRYFVLRGRSAPGGGVASALGAAIEDWLGTRGLGTEGALAIVRASLSRTGAADDEDVTELMALLRPERGAAPDARRASATFVRALRRLAQERPVMAVLDDLDPGAGTAAFLEIMLFELELEPFACFVGVPVRTVRPTDALHATLARTAQSEGRRRHVVKLGPIAPEALAAYLERAHRLSPHVADRVARRAEGNPLFAAHLAAMEDWQSVDALAKTPLAVTTSADLPSPLRALLEASLAERLGRVASRERAERLLENVAILGARVDLDLLGSFVDEAQRGMLDDDLDALIDAGILADAGRDEVAFEHRLLRDAVLESIAPRRRRRLHATAAALREARGRPEELGAIGEHWAAAGESGKAAEAWLRAHEAAERARDGERAVHWGRHALSALSADDARRAPLTLAVGRALRNDAQLGEAEALLSPLFDSADADTALQALEVLAEIAQEKHEMARWAALIERGRERLGTAGRRGRGALLRADAFFANMHREFDRALASSEEALALSDEPWDLFSATRRFTFACLSRARTADARAQWAATLARLEEHGGALVHEARALASEVDMNTGHAETALEPARELVDLYRRSGRMANRVSATVHYAAALLVLGRFEEALAWSKEADSLAVRFSLETEIGRARGSLLLAEIGLGRPERALAAVRAIPLPPTGPGRNIAGVMFGLAHAAAGEIEEARRLVPEDPSALPPSAFFNVALDMLADALTRGGAHDVAARVLDALIERCEGVDERLHAAAREKRAMLTTT